MRKPLLYLCSIATSALSLQATVLVSEPYDYPNGVFLVGQNGGTGFSNAWTNAAGAWQVQSGGIEVSAANTFQPHRFFTTPVSGEFYMSATFTMTGETDDTYNNVLTFNQPAVGTGNPDFYFGLRNNQYAFGFNGNFTNPLMGGTYTQGDTDMLVVKFTFNGDQGSVDLWVNPSSEGETPLLTISDVTISSGATSFGTVRSWATFLDTGTARQDGFIIGTTFQDVIPEPGHYAAVFAVTFLGVAMVIRRRKIR